MLASSGMRAAFRLISQAASHGRSIHIPSNALGRQLPHLPGGVSSSKGKGVVDAARNALTRLLYGTNPISTTQTQAFRRAVHTTQPIRNQFSFPVRHALSNSSMRFARPPAVQRGMTEVGLGTARKFSTTRPIFQNLVQNIPVAGRSMYEVDLDLQKKKARRIVSKRLSQEQSTKPQRKMKASRSALDGDFDKYFPARPADEEIVSTVLTVPLVPYDAPAAPSVNLSEQSFLPLHEVVKTFQTHGKHSRRISSLFQKLDQARVWVRGAHYEAFGSVLGSVDCLAPPSALCTSLRIVFDGWTAVMVRDVIGEAGIGWCALQENKIRASEKGPFSLESSRAPTPAPSIVSSPNVWDQTSEFIMPSIDFSSSFLDHADIWSPAGHLEGNSGASTPWMSDDLSLPSTRPGSEFGDYEAENEWNLAPRESAQLIQRNETGLAFSADFMRRSQDMDVWSNF